MGLESYLFQVEFESSVEESRAIDILLQSGMNFSIRSENKPETEYRSYFFKLRTQSGLTEAHLFFDSNQKSIDSFSLRFSVMSPRTVIKQTLDLLSQINSITPIRIYDTEIHNHLYRKLRIEGIVDKNFQGIQDTKGAERIKQLCYITTDLGIFIKNEFEVQKREIVLNNKKGEVIEGGVKTTEAIEKKNQFHRFISWIFKEL